MNNIRMRIIEDLMQLRGKSADFITKFLKNCGGENGTMADGLINIVRILNEDKLQCVKTARANGIVIGAVSTAAVGTAVIISNHLYTKHKEKKQCREKMERVAEILRQEAAIANDESTLPVETEAPTENDDVIPTEANTVKWYLRFVHTVVHS